LFLTNKKKKKKILANGILWFTLCIGVSAARPSPIVIQMITV
jgi:hypothetical protein